MYSSFLHVDNEDSNQTKMIHKMCESSHDAQHYVTVVPAKRDSGVIFCLRSLSKILTCTPSLALTRIDRSLVS